MKRIIVLMICAFVLISLAGCRQADTGVVTPSKPAESGDGGEETSAETGDDSADDTSDDSSDQEPSGPQTKIDLTVSDAYFNPTFPDTGEDVELKVIFKNQGTEDSGPFDYKIKILKDGSVLKEDTFTASAGLARGVDEKITQMYVFSNKGTYSAEIYIDPDKKINELIETNNYMKAKADATVI